MMNKRPSHKSLKEECLKDQVFKNAYDALEAEFKVIEEFIKARKHAKVSQIELAKRLKSQQPAIARLEKGGYANASISNLNKVANALGYSLHVTLKSQKKLN
jgi:predicted transcriptional regulator